MRSLIIAVLVSSSLIVVSDATDAANLASGKKLDETYKLAWLRGLKTSYYLRTVGATHAEKSTVKAGHMNAVSSSGEVSGVAAMSAGPVPISGAAGFASQAASDIKFCSIDSPDCERGVAAPMRYRNNQHARMSISAWCSHATLS